MPVDLVENLGEAKLDHAIIRVFVDNLFGQFNYDLEVKKDSPFDARSLLILYGDNGSGKTTILNLLYHLLSSEDNQGHKSAVAKVRFSRFAVELSSGITIEAVRLGDSQIGPYRAAILKESATLEAVELPTSSRNDEEASPEERKRLKSFLDRLKELGLAVLFLPDDRKILGQNIDFERQERIYRRQVTSNGISRWFSTVQEEEDTSGNLTIAVDRAATWIRQQALAASNKGQKGVHSIYIDITKNVVSTAKDSAVAVDKKATSKLIEKLKSLSARSEAYSRFGFTSDLPVDSILESIQTGTQREQKILHGVITPYVQSVEARLDALEAIFVVVERFIENVNAFLVKTKRLSYDIRRGFKVASLSGDPLILDMLSSGEKQLLLLMCNTLAARDQASILIIDEPEISLNVKWQRRLVQSLLDCIKGSQAQLVFATHSIELTARHKSSLVQLIHRDSSHSEVQTNGV